MNNGLYNPHKYWLAIETATGWAVGHQHAPRFDGQGNVKPSIVVTALHIGDAVQGQEAFAKGVADCLNEYMPS